MSLFQDDPLNKPLPPSPSELKKEIRRQLHELAPTAIKTIKEIMETGEPEDSNRLKAAISVLDRTGNGPHSVVEVNNVKDFTKTTDEDLRAKLARLHERYPEIGKKLSEPNSKPRSSTVH